MAPDLPALFSLELDDEVVHERDLSRLLDPREHDAVEAVAGSVDDCGHIPVGPLSRAVVDPDDRRLSWPNSRHGRRHDVATCLCLGRRSDTVFEVEENLVLGEALGIF